MKTIIEKIKEIAEAHKWISTVEGDRVYFENWSPAGENIVIEDLSLNNLSSELLEYAQNFDIDDHVEMWIDARRAGMRGVPSVSILVDDAREIEDMLWELAEAVEEADEEADNE